MKNRETVVVAVSAEGQFQCRPKLESKTIGLLATNDDEAMFLKCRKAMVSD